MPDPFTQVEHIDRDRRWLKLSPADLDRLCGFRRGRSSKIFSGRARLQESDRVAMERVIAAELARIQAASPMAFLKSGPPTAMACVPDDDTPTGPLTMAEAFATIREECPDLDTVLLSDVRGTAYVAGNTHQPAPTVAAEVGRGRAVAEFVGADWEAIVTAVAEWASR